MDDYCCPECGETDFTQRRVAQVEVTIRVREGRYEEDVSEETIDGGDRDAPLRCECGAEYHDLDELITVEAYNTEED